MTATTSFLFLHDNGRATCAKHAGDYLAASIAKRPDAKFHETMLGKWERVDMHYARFFGVKCDCCSRSC